MIARLFVCCVAFTLCLPLYLSTRLIAQERDYHAERVVLDDDAVDGTWNTLTLQVPVPGLGANRTVTFPDADGTAVTSASGLLTANQILFGGSTGLAEGSADLLWTDASSLLSIGGGLFTVDGTNGNVTAAGTIQSGSSILIDGTTPGSHNITTTGAEDLTIAPGGGDLNVTGNVNTTTQYDIGGNRVLSLQGTDNTWTGVGTGAAITTGFSNVGVGTDALGANTTGIWNVAVGSAALGANTTGGGNVAVGISALTANTTGDENVAVGEAALSSNTTGIWNVAVGSGAMLANTTGNRNVALGLDALSANTTGADNVAVGASALTANTTADDNTAFGANALAANTTGAANVAVGSDALQANTTGNGNVAVGWITLIANTTGENNVAIGPGALQANTTASDNIAIGGGALRDNVTGISNVAIGEFALRSSVLVDANTAIGAAAGATNVTGSNNTFLGAGADVSADGFSNATAIGAGTIVGQSNAMILGNGADVGIGTGTPGAKLDVNGTMNVSGASTLAGTVDAQAAGNVVGDGADAEQLEVQGVAGGAVEIDVDGDMDVSGTVTVDELRILQSGDVFYTSMSSGTQAADILYVLPVTVTATSTVEEGLLQLDDATGQLSWVDPNEIGDGNFWSLAGNAGTTPGTDFIGTTDLQDLQFHVNNIERLVLTTNGALQRNTGGDPRGADATDLQTFRAATTQVASGVGAVIGGGGRNTASGEVSTISGGQLHVASGGGSFVGGGTSNTSTGNSAVVTGGFQNNALDDHAVVAGGHSNTASGVTAAIPGGRGLTLDAGADRSFGFLGGNTGANDMTISASDVAVFGNTDLWLANNDNGAGQLRFYEANATTGAFPGATNYSAFRAVTQSADIEYDLPPAAGSVGGVLAIDAVAGTQVTLDWTSDPEFSSLSLGGATAVTNSRIVVNAGHWTSQGTAPTAAGDGTNLAAGVTLDALSTDVVGIVSATDGGGVGTGVITVTFDAAYGSSPVVLVVPANSVTAQSAFYVSNITTASFDINVMTTSGNGTDVYAFNYHVIEMD